MVVCYIYTPWNEGITGASSPMDSFYRINLGLLRNGDRAEFERIFIEFSGILYALSFQYTRNHSMAEEMVQDAFVKLWEVKSTLSDTTNIKNFLFTITKNNCLNYLRNQQIILKHHDRIRARELRLAEESLCLSGPNVNEFEEMQRRISQAVAALPDELRRVFEMSRYEGMKYGEIARRLGISDKTVEARISKALKILRQELKDFLPAVLFFLKVFR